MEISKHQKRLKKLKASIGPYNIILGLVTRSTYKKEMNPAHLKGKATIIMPLKESTARTLALASLLFDKVELVDKGIYLETY